jgi:hypothetical protein
MKNNKHLGIWMDHSNAYLMELKNDTIVTNNVVSGFTHQDKVEGLHKSESLMHNKEQHEQSGYYKKIADAIREYQKVILFGPTSAKSELLNLLSGDHLFENINIEIKDTDKMTETQMHAFVRAYFK